MRVLATEIRVCSHVAQTLCQITVKRWNDRTVASASPGTHAPASVVCEIFQKVVIILAAEPHLVACGSPEMLPDCAEDAIQRRATVD